MRKTLTIALAVLALALTGASTKEGWPACSEKGGVETFAEFMQAIGSGNEFAVQFYQDRKECGPMKGGMRAEILEERIDHKVRIRIHPVGFPPYVVWTIKESLTE